jgi:transcriptional regulator with XRE-family HTH domain
METLFAENIFRLRISNKMTQTEVANQLEMTRPNYIKLEKGESQPKDATVQKIARLYKLNPETLFSTTPKIFISSVQIEIN